MLKKIENLTNHDISCLKSNWYGRKILSSLNLPCDIYTSEYGYILVTDGYMCIDISNSTANPTANPMATSLLTANPMATADSILTTDQRHELEFFIMLHNSSRIDGYSELMPGYTRLRRTMFEMREGNFPCNENEITRHGNTYLYKNTTKASVVYDTDGIALVAGVRTQKEFRGKGQARELLNYIFNENKNKKMYLYALDIRRSYYIELGYEIVGTDFVLERDVRIDKDEL